MKKTNEQVAQALVAALTDFLNCMQGEVNPTTEKDLYTMKDLAELLDKKPDTIRRWVCDGQFGEPVRIGRSLMVTQEGYQKYLEDHRGPVQKRVTRRPKKIPPSMTAEQYQALRI